MPDEVPHPDWDGLFTLTLAVLVCLITAGTIYLYWLYRVVALARARDDQQPADDWLIVPGKRLVAGSPDTDFSQRLRRAAELYSPQPAGRIVILGGRTAGARISEAQAGMDYLCSLESGAGFQILLEADSQNTLTNLRNVREMLEQQGQREQRVTLISNRYHLTRLGLIAASLGIRHRLRAAEPWLPSTPATLLHLARESFFCLWFVVGKGWARLTCNQRMLSRVT